MEVIYKKEKKLLKFLVFTTFFVFFCTFNKIFLFNPSRDLNVQPSRNAGKALHSVQNVYQLEDHSCACLHVHSPFCSPSCIVEETHFAPRRTFIPICSHSSLLLSEQETRRQSIKTGGERTWNPLIDSFGKSSYQPCLSYFHVYSINISRKT